MGRGADELRTMAGTYIFGGYERRESDEKRTAAAGHSQNAALRQHSCPPSLQRDLRGPEPGGARSDEVDWATLPSVAYSRSTGTAPPPSWLAGGKPLSGRSDRPPPVGRVDLRPAPRPAHAGGSRLGRRGRQRTRHYRRHAAARPFSATPPAPGLPPSSVTAERWHAPAVRRIRDQSLVADCRESCGRWWTIWTRRFTGRSTRL